jgi:hypothetical protein
MTDLEDRLRLDLQAAGERTRPGSIRPLQAPNAARRRRAALRRRVIRIVAPVTAAIAVIGIVTGVTLSGAATGHNAHRNSPPVVAEMLPGKTPPYYVVLADGIRNGREVITATVRASATAAVLSSVLVWRSARESDTPVKPSRLSATPSTTTGPFGISADANDRTFAISGPGGDFLLHLSADGRSAHLSRIPYGNSGNLSWGQIALSPSGTELAIAITYSPGRHHIDNPGIEVLSLRTGAKKIWVQHTGGRLFLNGIAWAPNGRGVAFQWGSGYGLLDLAGTPSGPGRLPVRGPGENLFRDSVHAASLTLITTKARLVTLPDGVRREVAQVVELKSLSGGLRRVLYQYTTRYHKELSPNQELGQDCVVLSEAALGVHALIACPQFGQLNGSKFTSLPGVAPVSGHNVFGAFGIGSTAAW